MGTTQLEKECIELIRLGKRTGNMKLRNAAQIAMGSLQADDGTPGLGEYLWENYVIPNLKVARAEAEKIQVLSTEETAKEEPEQKKARSLTINLTDNDTAAIISTAAEVGLSVGELFENFIADLTGGAGTNGSDERGLAQDWFDRCWFGMFPEETFLRYALQNDCVEDIIKSYQYLQDCERNIAHTEKELEVGANIIRGKESSWDAIVNSDGNQSYATHNKWVADQKDYMQQERDGADYVNEELQNYWKDFLETTDKTDLSMREEIEKVIEWKIKAEKELAPNTLKAKSKTPDISILRAR